MKAKITEIFHSIQGEGLYTGVPQVFVRFFGCTLQCAWCDTPQSRDGSSFRELSVEAVMEEINQLWTPETHSVSLTGGEPLEQIDVLKELVPRLKKEGRKIFLETNGIHAQALSEIIKDIDIISMDIKLPTATGERPQWDAHKRFLSLAAAKDIYVKTVITENTTYTNIQRAAELIAEINENIPLVLQPNAGESSEALRRKCSVALEIGNDIIKKVSIMSQKHKEWKIK